MKFQRVAEFTRVPPDLTDHYCYSIQIHGSPSIVSIAFMALYVQTESNTARWQLCARGIGGKRLFEGNGRDTRWIVSDFVRVLNEATEVTNCCTFKELPV
jgi:hypothetical protein